MSAPKAKISSEPVKIIDRYVFPSGERQQRAIEFVQGGPGKGIAFGRTVKTDDGGGTADVGKDCGRPRHLSIRAALRFRAET